MCVSICVCMCSKVIFPIHKIVNRCAMSQIALGDPTIFTTPKPPRPMTRMH